MQCGADIYCDTQLIFDELERRAPTPSLHPGGDNGLAFALSRWIDGDFFELCVRAAFAPVADTLPPALIADRTRLYFGPEGDMQREALDMPHTLAQLRPQLGWLDTQLANGGPFLMGSDAGMADLLAWYVYWFVSGRYVDAESFLTEFPALREWSLRIDAIGHGTSSDLSPTDALAIAKAASPTTAAQADDRDPQGLAPDMPVGVVPLSRNDVEVPVNGTVVAVSRERIAIARNDDACGDVVVHFPRVGYRVTRLDDS